MRIFRCMSTKAHSSFVYGLRIVCSCMGRYMEFRHCGRWYCRLMRVRKAHHACRTIFVAIVW